MGEGVPTDPNDTFAEYWCVLIYDHFIYEFSTLPLFSLTGLVLTLVVLLKLTFLLPRRSLQAPVPRPCCKIGY